MAVGPQLIGIQPNNSDLLVPGDVRQEAPRELVFRFDDSQVIDPTTLSGIRVTRSGGDGTFSLASVSSDFGTNGKADIQLTSKVVGVTYIVQVNRSDMGAGAPPVFSVNGGLITIQLNSNVASPTTARGLVDSINASPLLTSVLSAKLNGGLGTTPLGTINPSLYSPIQVNQTNDIVVQPGSVSVGASPNENEVTFRFGDVLKDDQYRVEVFGFDDPGRNIKGLRNVGLTAGTGELFRPSVAGTRQDTLDFRLDLGSQVTAVVPQPVQRVNGQLQQLRDTIVVYFDSDKLLVENDASGNPTAQSVENPLFYQLIYTKDTVRNTDDTYFYPTSVTYNATANTATLRFLGDINNLVGSNDAPATFRLRIGTSESAPITPTYSEAAATVLTDLNTNGAITLRFTAKQVGEAGSGIQLEFSNTNSLTPNVTAVGRVIKVDMGRANLTAQELIDLIRNSSAAASLVSVDFEPGGILSTVVGNRTLSYSPLTLLGLGSSFDTATNIGKIGSALRSQTSMVVGSSIDPESFVLDLPGANDDPGHRTLPQNVLNGFEEHVNPAFGADAINGITTIYYNFKRIFSTDNSGTPLQNSIISSPEQMKRARESLALWARYLGVQFVETENLGLTIATGALTGVRPTTLATQTQTEAQFNFGVRIDRTFNEPLIVLSDTATWNENYGESFFRSMTAAIGMVLGLQHAGDLPETTLMRLDPTFMAGSGALINANDAQLNASDERFEPIFPGNQDVLHGRHLYRPDGSDIDLYRFEVDFGSSDRVGLFTAETYAQRLPNSSSLDTNLQLYREIQARASTSFGIGESLSVRFEAVRPGTQGNQLQVFFTQSRRGANVKPDVIAFPNAISIDLNTTPGSESTVADVLEAIRASAAASRLVRVTLERGAATTKIGANVLTQNPLVLTGGRMELISKNDNYFSKDSMIHQELGSGIYYLGISASGNDEYNAAMQGTGFGGQSQGDYQIRLQFRAQVDASNVIKDIAGANDSSVGLDGDGDGTPGGVHNFWFQTRPLDRVLSFNAGGSSSLETRVITVVGGNGVSRDFEFDSNGSVTPGRFPITYTPTSTQGELANALAAAIVGRPELGVSAIANGARIVLRGERLITIDPRLLLIDVQGKTIFVDKSAGPNADGSLARPFNNIAGSGVANAFSAAQPGDIVRIVGNGGADGNLATVGDNFAYEFGAGILTGTTLTDGANMEVPRGVTAMIDAGAVFKMRQARIGVGSSNLNIDRSRASLQVLGAPVLLDVNGNAVRQPNGSVATGNVFFTSWLDESIGFDTYGPRTVPGAGDWGGISFRRDVDSQAGRKDLEDEGVFLQYVNQADIRFGGGLLFVDSNQTTVNSIEMFDTRPTITNNRVSNGASHALSALPNSFEETNFNEPRYQVNGVFTSDYDRVGPEIHGNSLVNNSTNGLFVRVDTPADAATKTLTVAGRFDDIDVVHVFQENLIVSGAPGGAILDGTLPPAELVSTGPNVGGTLLPGTYNYKITYVDRNGNESIPSNSTTSQVLIANQTAISIAGLPAASGDFVARRLYRSNGIGTGPYELVADLDRATSTYLDLGRSLGGLLVRDRADLSGAVLSRVAGGTLAVNSYSYRIVMIDQGGREGLASNPVSFNLATAGSVRLDQIPLTLPGYAGRRIYRSTAGGSFVLVGELPDSTSVATTVFTDTGSVLGGSLSPETLAIKRPRTTASLVIDPGSVLKLEGARIEAGFGANIIAEGTDGLPIVFTSKLDDSVGAGGTFDTNNNGSTNGPSPRNWGGIYMSPTSTLSVDYARFSYGGGVTKLESTFRAFNTIELQQAEGRIAHSVFENNADGFGGQGPGTRLGRLSNQQSTIFVRGTQPVIIDNIFRGNAGSAITIDANSMTDDLISDPGRQTGDADIESAYAANRGPLVRGNRMIGNGLNGLEVRGDVLTTASVWDDTDIAHVVFDGIYVGNVQHEGGLRLQSSPTESLVVKFDGYGSNFNRNLGAGITANGQLMSGDDRVGGTVHIVGQPGFPVILTSLKDDTVGAGLQPDGKPQNDTNNDGIGSIPKAADWRGILLDQYSNDRNVGIVLETESFTAAAPGPNGRISTAQSLGSLAPNATSSNENLRIGFSVEGVLSQNEDVDIYSFSAEAGTQIWLDVDGTKSNLDMVLELLDANGSLLARSNDSGDETNNPSLITVSGAIDPSSVNPLPLRTTGVRTTSRGQIKEDGTTNVKDPGMRILLPGAPGSRSTYYFRVRSAGRDLNAVQAGISSGSYQVQVRMRERQEFAGSTIDFADIRYAMNGVRLRGQPGSSPLIGESAEDESSDASSTRPFFIDEFQADNGTAIGQPITGNRPQYIGNILDTANGGISVAGSLFGSTDVDFYRMIVSQQDLVGGLGGFAPVVFDIDYADGLNRPDTSINIFREEPSQFGVQYRLIFSGDSSNIADDQKRPLTINDLSDLSRGSVGTKDGYIGPVALAQGTYVIGISSAAFQPRTKIINPFDITPINSVRRIVDESAIPGGIQPVVQNFLPRRNIGATLQLDSKTFSLAGYTAEDQPAAYLNYTHPSGTFEVFVKDAAGGETRVATTQFPVSNLRTGTNSFKIPLGAFAGQDGLSMIFRSTNAATNINNIIIGFGERGEQIGVGNEAALFNGTFLGISGNASTRVFSLETYQFSDQPQATFNYEIFNGILDIFLVSPFGTQRIATSGTNITAGETRLIAGSPQSINLNLSNVANLPNLRLEFRTRTDDPTRVFVGQVTMELGDGSRINSTEANSTYASVAVPSTTVTSGPYQLEVRLAETFFQSTGAAAPTLTKVIDTNDRLADQISIVAPSGADLTDGDTFEISDGGNRVVFEFSTDVSVGLGNIPVRFVASDASFTIAQKVRDAINNPNVQSRLKVSAATSGGIDAGTAGRDSRLNLFGNATVRTLSATNVAGRLTVIAHSGDSDRNITRDQGQVLVQNSFIRNSRDYGIWSEPADRLEDPADDPGFLSFIMQQKPAIAGTQAVRNLLTPNNSVIGGLLPGVVIQNNVLEEGGLGGVHIQGENPIWMITPSVIPATDNSTAVNTANTHVGGFVDDRDLLIIDSDRTRVTFEFEDLAGAPTGGPTFGSGAVEGNGINPANSFAYYRDDAGNQYQRIIGTGLTAIGTTGLETMMMLRDSILGSILVTNGTTQQVKATVGESLLGPDFQAPLQSTFGYPNYFNRPALYLEGVTNIQTVDFGNGSAFDVQRLDLGQSPQPHARLINNTIIGTDGRVTFDGRSPTTETNDTLQTAIETWQGTAHNPLNYTATGSIGDNPTLARGQGQDVDMYQFKLGVGERVIVDIDAANGSSLNSVLQIFDSRGIPQQFRNSSGSLVTFSDNDAAPGEGASLDPYIDFTATTPGVYYAALSSVGNVSYDPFSQANRQVGSTTGGYSMTLSVRHPQSFTITVEDATSYNAGDTFTIFQIPDLAGQPTSGRTFEFTFGGGVQPGNIPIQLNATWRFPDVARAIAKAINEGNNGQPSLPNTQALPNGTFGTASPLPAVHARALGGLAGVLDAPLNTITGNEATLLDLFTSVGEEGLVPVSKREIERLLGGPFHQVNQGLELFPLRSDGNGSAVSAPQSSRAIASTLSSMGLGHNRESTTPVSRTSVADGTTEKYVVVDNAAFIRSNGTIIVDPDANANNNLDQIIPESGILASRGASPTILNNVFFNLQTPIVNEESRYFPITGSIAPYGSDNPNAPVKPGEVIIGGSIYQYDEPAVARNRFGTGIEQGPTNVPNTSFDFNTDVANGVKLFTNAQAGQYLPAPGSPLIDSAIDTLPERPRLAAVKQAMGIGVSSIVAPLFDLVGQQRVDDPSVAPPSGLGQIVTKDRGAFDRADFKGPAAILLNPIDNDSLGVDRDGADSVVRLDSGVFSEFRIQLADGNEPANPFKGVGIDDNSVVNSVIPDRRLTGASIVFFENGRVLTEGIDYRFTYNATRDEIVLTPLAGVWRNDRIYEISLNNKDRFVVTAPSGDQLADGDKFTISDGLGGVVQFEFDSGFRLQLPQGLSIQVPIAGAGAGGVVDGDRFTIDDGVRSVTFELDLNNNFLAGNVRVPFNSANTRAEIAQSIATAISSTALNVTPRILPDGEIFLGALAGTRVNTVFSSLIQPQSTLALQVPALGARPGGVTDGQVFSVSDGLTNVIFEIDTNNVVGAGNTRIDTSGAITANDIAVAIRSAILNSSLKISPSIIGNDTVYLGLSPAGSVATQTSRLSLVGVARTIADGHFFDITLAGVTKTFEFTTDGTVGPNRIAIPFNTHDADPLTVPDTEDELGVRTAGAILAANIGMNPVHVRDGNISLGGTPQHQVSVVSAPTVGLFGTPGVQTNTTLEIIGSLVLRVPTRGGIDLPENGTFSITSNNRTVVFEFDGDASGPSLPGNVTISFTTASSANDVANLMATAITAAGLGISASNVGAGRVDIGLLADDQVRLVGSSLVSERGNVGDGEFFTINNGVTTITFEFENVSTGSGFVAGRTPILFSNSSSRNDVIVAMKAAIEASTLGLTTVIIGTTSLRLNATPSYVIDTSRAPSINHTGVPGAANAILFAQDISFTSEQVAQSIVRSINAASNTNLEAKIRGGNTLFVENAVAVSSLISNYYLRAIEDLGGNDLKSNQINNETQFTILMPGVDLDYGDAPDPVATTQGRYPTLQDNNGARHVIAADGLALGAIVTPDSDGRPTANADGDAGSDDGVIFTSPRNPSGIFNKLITTDITITASGNGFVDAWIDFNADGDWEDPNEQILTSVPFVQGALTQTFAISMPSTAPTPLGVTQSFARFRLSRDGNLQPIGLAADGEVEDYAVTLVPGTPPTAVNDSYDLNEDAVPGLQTNDVNGQLTPNFRIDDGVTANDIDPEGGPYTVSLVQGPANADPTGGFTLNPNGTFSYRPVANFFGTDTFTYRIRDAVLTSNNVGTVTLVVRERNDVPIAANDQKTINEDVVTNINESELLANDQAGPLEGAQVIRISSVNPVSQQGGSVSLANGVVTYVPKTDFAGVDTFVYTIIDNGTTNGVPDPLQSSATVTVTVLDQNDAPTTQADSINSVEDVAVSRTPSFFIGNDSPGPANELSQGQVLTFIGVNPDSTNGGSVTFANGQVTYTPPQDFVGVDTFFYIVEDNGLSGTSLDPKRSTGTVSVSITGLNDPPVVRTSLGTIAMEEDEADRIIDLANFFFDPDVQTSGDQLVYSIVPPFNSSLVTPIINGSRLTLRLNADQNGTATIQVRATDGALTSITDTLTLNVGAVPDAPRIAAGIPDQNANEDSLPLNLNLSNFFTDPDILTNGDSLTFSVVSNTNSGLVTSVINGNQLQMTFAPNLSGRSTITIRATDSTQRTISDTFDMVVTAVNDGPTTVNDTFYSVPQGAVLQTNDATGRGTVTQSDNGVLANDSDIEGDSFTARVVARPALGTLSLNSDGNFTYTATTARFGDTDTFTYEAVDVNGAVSRVTTVSISIGRPTPPKFQNPVIFFDVNADGFVSPIDALLVINLLNIAGSPSVPVGSLGDPPPYLDVNGDNEITPLDIAQVVNQLNIQTGSGEGEGNSDGPSSDLLSLGWQTMVTRPMDGLAIAMESRSAPKESVIGPVQGASTIDSDESLQEYLAGIGTSELDEMIDEWVTEESDFGGLADQALDDLLGRSSSHR